MTYFLLAIIIGILVYAWLMQIVWRGRVTPVKDGQYVWPPFHVIKRRWRVIWERHKFLIGMLAGVIVGLIF